MLHPPLGPASPPPTTAMLSIKEQNFGTSLNGIGFPEAQRVPTRRFQRSLSVVIAPEGSSCGIQILLESRPFHVEEWLNELLVSQRSSWSVLKTLSCAVSHWLHTRVNRTSF